MNLQYFGMDEAALPAFDIDAKLNIFIKENTLYQIENLLTYPFVQKALEKAH